MTKTQNNDKDTKQSTKQFSIELFSAFSAVIRNDLCRKLLKCVPSHVQYVVTFLPLNKLVIFDIILVLLFFSGKATKQLRCGGDVFLQVCALFNPDQNSERMIQINLQFTKLLQKHLSLSLYGTTVISNVPN